MRLLLFAILATACKSREEPPAPPAAKPAAVAAVASDGIVLTSPGAEPRRALRYHLTKGSSTPFELAMDTSIDVQPGTAGGPLPTLVVQMTLGVDDVLPDGSAKIRNTVVAAAGRERAGTQFTAAQMSEQTQQLAGIAITGTLAPSGAVHDSHVEGIEKLAPGVAQSIGSLGQSLEQVAMPLPADPVGVGATWKTHRLIDQGGVKLAADTTFEIVALAGDQLTFKSTAVFTGAPQHMTQGELAVDIQRAAGHSESTGTMDLSRMVMTGDITASFRTAMSVGGQASTLALEMHTAVTQGEHKAP